MPSQDRRSSRWCCKDRGRSLASFHQDIVPSDVSRFHLRRRASPLLAPTNDAESRHDRALLHHILKDQQSKHLKPHVLNVEQHEGELLGDIERTQHSETALVKLPQIAAPGVHAERHKGISNGMLLKICLVFIRLQEQSQLQLLLCRGFCCAPGATRNRP